jgi:hypothetical protein
VQAARRALRRFGLRGSSMKKSFIVYYINCTEWPYAVLMSGTFVQYTAGILDDYQGTMLFVALTEHPLLKTIFQKHFRGFYVEQFNMNEFKFTLIGIMPRYNVFRYTMFCGDFTMTLLLVGVDVTRFCNPFYNVDFVHFFWDNYRSFSFKKYAITVLPPPSSSIAEPRMLWLQYYRAKSNGWRDSGNCDDCVTEHALSLRLISDYLASRSLTGRGLGIEVHQHFGF